MIDHASGETRRPRVLVVEDDRSFALALLFALEPHADVCLVASGAAALARLGAGEQYDAVVCDLDLPDLTGEELWHEVRAHHPGHADRLLIASAGAWDAATAAFLAGLGDRYLRKPVPGATLLAAIRRVAA